MFGELYEFIHAELKFTSEICTSLKIQKRKREMQEVGGCSRRVEGGAGLQEGGRREDAGAGGRRNEGGAGGPMTSLDGPVTWNDG